MGTGLDNARPLTRRSLPMQQRGNIRRRLAKVDWLYHAMFYCEHDTVIYDPPGDGSRPRTAVKGSAYALGSRLARQAVFASVPALCRSFRGKTPTRSQATLGGRRPSTISGARNASDRAKRAFSSASSCNRLRSCNESSKASLYGSIVCGARLASGRSTAPASLHWASFRPTRTRGRSGSAPGVRSTQVTWLSLLDGVGPYRCQ